MKILFVDLACPKPYDYDTDPLGGTEATVLRIAKGLSEKYFVGIAQKGRTQSEGMFLSEDDLLKLKNITHVVALRDPGVMFLPLAKKLWPDAKYVIWLHDLFTPTSVLAQSVELLNTHKPTIVCVSDFHKTDTVAGLETLARTSMKFPVTRIYNPVCIPKVYGLPQLPNIDYKSINIDQDKLIFYSSPHKGLDQVLTCFDYLKLTHPNFKLYIANPGYLKKDIDTRKDVYDLGCLPHAEVLKHVAESFCVFYPSSRKGVRETFGLVLAEANALGTPVIAHYMGAAQEVLGFKSGQAFDCTKIDNIVEKISKWKKEGRPNVSANPAFSLEAVIKDWKTKILG